MVEIGIKAKRTERSCVLIERSDEVMAVSESMAMVMKAMSSINRNVSGVRSRGAMVSFVTVIVSCKK